MAIHLPNHAPRNVPVLLALEDMWGSNLFLCKLRFCFACFSSGHNGVIIESDQPFGNKEIQEETAQDLDYLQDKTVGDPFFFLSF